MFGAVNCTCTCTCSASWRVMHMCCCTALKSDAIASFKTLQRIALQCNTFRRSSATGQNNRILLLRFKIIMSLHTLYKFKIIFYKFTIFSLQIWLNDHEIVFGFICVFSFHFQRFTGNSRILAFWPVAHAFDTPASCWRASAVFAFFDFIARRAVGFFRRLALFTVHGRRPAQFLVTAVRANAENENHLHFLRKYFRRFFQVFQGHATHKNNL